jgi:hypothetical protein
MKSPIRFSTFVVVLVVALAVKATATTPEPPLAKAAAEHSYPSVLPLTLEVSGDAANELRSLRDFTITAQREGDYAPTIVIGPVAPFTSENTCASPMPAGIRSCVVNAAATSATLRIDWRVPEAGNYRFVLSGRRGSSDRVEMIGAFDLEARD